MHRPVLLCLCHFYHTDRVMPYVFQSLSSYPYISSILVTSQRHKGHIVHFDRTGVFLFWNLTTANEHTARQCCQTELPKMDRKHSTGVYFTVTTEATVTRSPVFVADEVPMAICEKGSPLKALFSAQKRLSPSTLPTAEQASALQHSPASSANA